VKAGTVIALGALILASCGGTIGVSSSYMRSIEPVGVAVNIPRSYMKTMQVYVHPSHTRALVAPMQREATADR
jgi:hypothetical protein